MCEKKKIRNHRLLAVNNKIYLVTQAFFNRNLFVQQDLDTSFNCLFSELCLLIAQRLGVEL